MFCKQLSNTKSGKIRQIPASELYCKHVYDIICKINKYIKIKLVRTFDVKAEKVNYKYTNKKSRLKSTLFQYS